MTTNKQRIFALFIMAASIFFAGVVSATADQEKEEEEPLSHQELVALEQFLRLSDEQLDRIQDAVARVRAMPVDKRQAHAEEIVRFRMVPREERGHFRDRWGWRSSGDREDWRLMMQSLSPEEREEIHETMNNLDAPQRAAFRLRTLDEWRKES